MGCDRREFWVWHEGENTYKVMKGEHVSAIVVNNNKGAATCDHFIVTSLLPHLQPFNGVNSCSI